MRVANKHSVLFWGMWAVLLALRSLGAVAVAAESNETTDPNNVDLEKVRVQELSEKLEDLLRQLRQERSDYYLQKTKADAEIERMRRNRDTLQSSLDDLRKQETDLDAEIEQHRSESDALGKQLEAKSGIQKVVRERVRSYCSTQKTAIENCAPYKLQERIARLESAFADSNDANSVSVSDQLSRIWSYVQDELRIARSSETYTGRMQMDDGASPHVRYFRVGQLILGFITENGKRAGMWSGLSGRKGWQHISDPKRVRDVRDAVDILDRRKGPRLVTLPVAFEPAETAGRDP